MISSFSNYKIDENFSLTRTITYQHDSRHTGERNRIGITLDLEVNA